MIRVILLSLLAIFSPGAIHAQNFSPTDFQRVLIPVSLSVPVRGAFGSLWDTRILVRNASANPVMFAQGTLLCPFCPGGVSVIEPFQYKRYRNALGNGYPGAILHVEKKSAHNVTLSARLVNLSDGGDLGVDLPVVRESAFLQNAGSILDVPVQTNFRRLLRIYEVDANNGASFDVRLFDSNDRLIRSVTVLTTGGGVPDFPGFPHFPAYAEVELDQFLFDVTVGSIRVEITPRQPSRWWAFVSITHNVTQRVTLAYPK